MGILNIDTVQTVAIVIALWINAKANGLQEKAITTNSETLDLQRDTLQASMFNEVTNRINELLRTRPDSDREAWDWYFFLFDSFDYYAFFANHDYLRPEMKKYCEEVIVKRCDNVESDIPSVAEAFRELPQERWNNLREYYLNATGMELTFTKG